MHGTLLQKYPFFSGILNFNGNFKELLTFLSKSSLFPSLCTPSPKSDYNTSSIAKLGDNSGNSVALVFKKEMSISDRFSLALYERHFDNRI